MYLRLHEVNSRIANVSTIGIKAGLSQGLNSGSHHYCIPAGCFPSCFSSFISTRRGSSNLAVSGMTQSQSRCGTIFPLAKIRPSKVIGNAAIKFNMWQSMPLFFGTFAAKMSKNWGSPNPGLYHHIPNYMNLQSNFRTNSALATSSLHFECRRR